MSVPWGLRELGHSARISSSLAGQLVAGLRARCPRSCALLASAAALKMDFCFSLQQQGASKRRRRPASLPPTQPVPCEPDAHGVSFGVLLKPLHPPHPSHEEQEWPQRCASEEGEDAAQTVSSSSSPRRSQLRRGLFVLPKKQKLPGRSPSTHSGVCGPHASIPCR